MKIFERQTLIDAISCFITKCYFTIGNLALKQETDIPVGIDLASYSANLCLYFFESKYVQQLISKGFQHVYKFRGTPRFSNELCAINDGGKWDNTVLVVVNEILLPLFMGRGTMQGFPNSGKAVGVGGELEILLGGFFLPGEGNLRRSDFDNLNLFQS